MESLSRDDNAFIRPSPTGGVLGGVASSTREAILICEAARYDVIIVETVGAGQSEITLRSLVDFLLLLLITGAGDELQGIKKGLIEIADAVVINKADGDNIARANAARAQIQRALQFVAPATAGWATRALTASGLTGAGIDQIWEVISEFTAQTRSSGGLSKSATDSTAGLVHNALERQWRELPLWA